MKTTSSSISTNATNTRTPIAIGSHVPEACLVISLAALAPLLYYHAGILWERQHFQFFPLAWAAFALLIFQQCKIQPSCDAWRNRLGIVSWVLGLLLGLVAGAFFSPWLAFAATTFCITGWGLKRLATIPGLRWLAWTLLLWITLPLPGQLDSEFINELQRLSSSSAGVILDLLNIPHLRQGTLIEIRDHRLFVDEACSGVDSLYSLIAITLVMLIWSERPLAVGFLTLASVPLWAWLGNVIRLLVIVYLLDQFNIDLSHGWKHTALGLCTFAVSSLCLLSTLNALTYLLKRFSLNVIPRDNGTWYRWYNNIVCFPGKSPVVSSNSDELDRPAKTGKQTPPPAAKQLRATPAWTGVVIVVIFSVGILGLTGRSMALNDRLNGYVVPHFDASQVDQVFGEQRFPEQIGTAKRLTYKGEDRSQDNFFGEHSRMWFYRDAISDIQFSVDFPFRGAHALWVCYTNSGKKVEGLPKTISSVAAPTRDGAPGVQRFTLRDELGNYSYLWFVMLDEKGITLSVSEQDVTRTRIMHGLNTALGGMLGLETVTYQFQMLAISSRELSESELNEYTGYFETAIPYAWSQIEQLVKLPTP